MFDNRLLTRAMAGLGCTKLDKLAYSIPSSQPNLDWSVTFRLVGIYRWEIDGFVRCIHNDAAVFGRMCMREFAGDWWKNSLAKHQRLEGGVSCPVANPSLKLTRYSACLRGQLISNVRVTQLNVEAVEKSPQTLFLQPH